MDVPTLPPTKREFHCSHCKGRIAIPYELPPTTAPCPHCGVPTTSPALDALPEVPPPAPVAGPPAPEPEPPLLAPPVRTPKAPPPEPVPVWRRALVPLAFIIVLAILCAGIVAALMKLKKRVKMPTVNVPVAESPAVPSLRNGWKTDAFTTLAAFY